VAQSGGGGCQPTLTLDMTADPAPPLAERESLADDPEDTAADHGRVGYGRLGRFSPQVLGLLLIIAIAAIWWVQRDTRPAGTSPGAMTGAPAPDVSLTLLDGSSIRVADLRGGVVVLNFWASWCAPCRDEMPELQAYWDEVQRTGEATEIIGVGIRTDNGEDARQFVADGAFRYPIGRDTDTDRPGIGPIEAAFGVPSAYPSTVIIRPDGIVDRYHLGPLNRAVLALMVEEARAASG
jgi:cytochrome c biogenesis protein CcmG, thiol:disulfide interchange protein DsbE